MRTNRLTNNRLTILPGMVATRQIRARQTMTAHQGRNRTNAPKMLMINPPRLIKIPPDYRLVMTRASHEKIMICGPPRLGKRSHRARSSENVPLMTKPLTLMAASGN